ncbi:hypothetical protein AVEN_77155-1 [Araneus ventricosus]|uniref:Uncharacterized protein n=1 Tax=Araneus ventricosus TaxID=182803 RepID=A0A4Y2IFJ1_ARAVE|nr:hypothetical protein AVEN_77155-1 [Araneus ventricosus]
MARRLGMSITEFARLVGCSRSAVVSIHAKWINEGDTSSRRRGIGRPRVIKKRTSEIVPLGTHSSADTVGYGTVQQTSHSPASVDQAPSSTTLKVVPGTSRLDHGRELTGRMNPDFSFITSMVVSGYAVCQVNSFSPLVQQVIHRLVVVVLCFGGHSHGRLWDP